MHQIRAIKTYIFADSHLGSDLNDKFNNMFINGGTIYERKLTWLISIIIFLILVKIILETFLHTYFYFTKTYILT